MTLVRKRDGRSEPWDKAKIDRAVKSCLINNLGAKEFDAASVAHQVADAVERIVRNLSEPAGVPVEEVQRLVIQQLWAHNHCEAAEQYTLYREKRRVERAAFPIGADEQRLIEEDAAHFPSPLQYYQFLSKFSRWQDKLGRRETWRETCDRVINWLWSVPKVTDVLTGEEMKRLHASLYNMEATCAMRVIQMAGPALDRCNVGVYNCAYAPIVDLFSFSEMLYVLMQGTGMGFSVEDDYVDQLPKVKKQKIGPRLQHVIEDSTEGWCDALKLGLETWFSGRDVEFNYSLIRPAGARLKTKGGQASGPKPLQDLLNFARKLILSRQGTYLDDIDVHDLCCMIGKIVQVGGVRRASLISLSDLDSTRMRNAKSGNWYEHSVHRTMANNSAVYDGRPSDEEFMEEWLSLCKAKSGERGIFNRKAVIKNAPSRRAKAKFGTNPCVTGDTLIETFDGHVRIDSVVGKEVKVWNGKEWSEVIPHITGVNQEVYDVSTDCGKLLRCTAYHTFYLADGTAYTADALDPGDVLEPAHPGDAPTVIASVRWSGVSPVVYCFKEPKRGRAVFNGILTGQCAEIVLRPFEFCNLSIVIAQPYDTFESLQQKVIDATYFGVIQSLCTRFNYLRPDWQKNCEEERLLGVDITGHADCPLLRYKAPSRAKLLQELRKTVAETRSALAKRFGINDSAADTCVKPGGNSGVFFDCANGVSPRFARYQIRWVRQPANSPMAKFLIDEGVPHAVAPEDPSLLVFGFPKEAPEGSTLRDDLSAVEQLENWLEWKQNWAEHSVSATIYIREDEWVEAGNWVLKNFNDVSGLSFLPKDNTFYSYAPNEEITKEQYDEMMNKFPKINWAKLRRYETAGEAAQPNLEYACVGGACELS